jgi:hypothetical protein
MRYLVAPILCLFASAAQAIPQQPATPLNDLCSIQFDADNTISPDSSACLDLLATTLKVSTRLQLLLTGSAAHNAAVRSYLTSNEAIPASAIRTATNSADPDYVRTSLVKPLPKAIPAPIVEAMDMAAPPPLGAAGPAIRAHAPSKSQSVSDPYSLGEQAGAWKASLQNGAIEYNVPKVMIAQQASTVTVIVHGYKDPNPHVLANVSGTVNSTLKVSDTMEVDLVGSPTEFTITPQATQATQFVPIDGYSTWIWSVTPINKASAQQLTIKVSLIPDATSGLPAQPLAETPYVVNVNVESLWSVLSDRWHQDPMKAIEYILPGGAGWAALGTLLTTLGVGTWLRNKLNKPSTTVEHTANQNPTPAV